MRSRFAPGLIVPLILAGLALLLMMPFLRPPTGNEALIGGDLVNQQYPLYSFIFDSVRNGDGLPLWNPYQFAGQTVVGNPQSSIYYPPAWIMAVIGVPRGVGWLVILHLWWGGWGMALFTRRLGASWAGALAGGIIYAFSGLMAAHLNAGHLNYLMCTGWLPWMAAAYLWAVGRRDWFIAALPGAAAVGMCILSGHPPMLYFGVVWLAVVTVYVVVTRQVSTIHAIRTLVIMLVVGGILGAALLLPVAEFTARSTRTDGGIGFSNSYAMPAGQLLTLLIPNLFGEPYRGYWGLPFYEELTAYIGILPLVALPLVRRRVAAVLLAGMMIVGVVVSTGIDGGLFSILYYLLPGYSLFRVPPRALYFFVVGGAGLTALLITDLQTAASGERVERLRPMLRYVLPITAALCMVGAFLLMNTFTASSEAENPPWRLVQAGNMTMLAALAVGGTWLTLRVWSGEKVNIHAAVALTLFLLLADVGRVSSPLVQVGAVDVPEMWKTMSRAAPASPDFRVMTVPNEITWQAGSTYTRHLNASGYDPLVSEDYQRLLEASGYNPTSPIARMLGVRYLISDQAYEFSGLSGLESLISKTEGGEWTIYEIADPLPRAFIAPALQVMDDEAASAGLASGEIDPLNTAIVEDEIDCPINASPQSSPNTEGGEANSTAVILNYKPNAVEIAARVEQPGILVLTDSYDPNWMVKVDGQPAELLRVHTALRGVCLPAGEHNVQFAFQPRAFYIGVIVSVLGWLVMGIVGLLALVRRRRRLEQG